MHKKTGDMYLGPVAQDSIVNIIRHVSLDYNLVIALIVLGDGGSTRKFGGEHLGSGLESDICE